MDTVPCPLFLPDTANCEAQPGAVIPVDVIRRCCEQGYARQFCPHAAASAADSARFLIKTDCNGTIEVAWSLERNHHPVATGTIVIDAARAGLQGASGTALERQAYALALEYQRQTGRQ